MNIDLIDCKIHFASETFPPADNPDVDKALKVVVEMQVSLARFKLPTAICPLLVLQGVTEAAVEAIWIIGLRPRNAVLVVEFLGTTEEVEESNEPTSFLPLE